MRGRNQLAQGQHNSRQAALPAIILPDTLDPALRRALEAIKERLEVREGSRGNPYERATTLRDVREAVRQSTPTENASAQLTSSTSDSTSRGQIDQAVARVEGNLRSEILRVDRALQSTMTSLFGRYNANDGLSALEAMAYAAASRYTQEMLADDLAAGAAKVFAGAVSGTAVMELAADGGYVVFKHRDANINGLGAGYTGVVRTGLGITAAGLVAGYNRQDTGAWQNSIVIDSATGDVTILGTLKAGSVIEAGAFVAPGMTMSTLLADVAAAEADALSAYNLADTKLDELSSYTLQGAVTVQNTGGIKAGTVTWNSTTGAVTGGSGVVFTENGITGVSGGTVTFAVSASGSASFKGDVVTGGDAQFSGKNSATRTVNIGGTNYSVDYSVWADATTNATTGSTVRAGLIGYASAATSSNDVGIIGRAPSTTKGVGVVGDGGYYGGLFTNNSASGYGLVARQEGAGWALSTVGKSLLQGNVDVTGSITASSNITAYSDIRLKEDLVPIETALDKVCRLTGYTFTRKDTGQRQTGLVAQDVQHVLPEAVEEGEYLSVAYGNLVGLLVEAIKELDRRTS